jgi:hypothetical protein
MATLVNSQITDIGSASTSLVLDTPPTINAGDILVITGQINNGGTVATFSRADWTEIEEYDTGTFSSGGFAYWKVADGSEDGGTVTVTSSQSVAGHGQVFVVSNSAGLDDWARVTDTAGTTEAPTAIDVTNANSLVVQVLHMKNEGGPPTPTAPSGTSNSSGDSPLITSFRQTTHVAHYEQASAGTAVTSTATWGNLTDGQVRTLWTFSFLNAGGEPEGQLIGGKLISGLLAGVLVN